MNLQVTEPYDWRLAPPKLQERDGYFSKIKAKIAFLVQLHGEKVSRDADCMLRLSH